MCKRIFILVCVLTIMLTSVVVSASEYDDGAFSDYEATGGLIIDTARSGITVTDSASSDMPCSSSPGGFVAETEQNVQSPASLGFLPFEIRYETHNGVAVIIKSFRVPVGVDPAVLVEADFEDAQYLFSMRHILLSDTLMHMEQRVVARTVNFTTEDDVAISQMLAPIIEFNEDGFVGQLELDRSSIQSTATGRESYTFPIHRTIEIANLNRNDVAYIPRTHDSLTLQDINWVPMGGQMRGDIMLPSSYTAQAIYAGVGRGERITGLENAAIYRGIVTRSLESENVFTIIYHGTRIVPESEIAFPWSHVLIGFGFLVFGVIVSYLILAKGIFGGRRNRRKSSDAPSIQF